MNKNLKVLLFILIPILIILAFSFYNGYFVETKGKIIDSDGNGIPNATVVVSYGCKSLLPIELEYFSLPKKVITYTNDYGEFEVEPYIGFPSLRSCKKYIDTFKQGYCGGTDALCSSALSGNGGSYAEFIKDSDKWYYITYKGLYYPSDYFNKQVEIKSKERNATIVLRVFVP